MIDATAKLGVEALYRKPNISKPAPGHKIYPYLLRKLPVTRPNQVWAMDIPYIPIARGFIYMATVLDWFTRRVLSWRVSILLEADFCIEAVEEALARHGKPDIFNTDQGSQFTSTEVIKVLASRKIKISCSIPDVCIDERRLPLFIARATLRDLIAGLEARATGDAAR